MRITFLTVGPVHALIGFNPRMIWNTVYPKKYAHGFVVLCFVVVMQSLIMNSHEVFIHIHQGCFAGTGAIVRLPQCQWSKPDGYGKISQCITTDNKAQQSKNYVHIYWDILYATILTENISFMFFFYKYSYSSLQHHNLSIWYNLVIVMAGW